MIKKLIVVVVLISMTLGSSSASADLLAPEQDDFRIHVVHNTDMVEVYGFKPNEHLTFEFFVSTTNDPPVKELTMQTFDQSSYVLFGFQHDQKLEPGNIVRVTDWGTSEYKELKIVQLKIEAPIYDSPVVTGTVQAGMNVNVSINDAESIHLEMPATVFGDGTWRADFSTLDSEFVLSEDQYIDASVEEPQDEPDGGGDLTRYVISAVNPSMEAYYSTDSIHVYNCSPNAFVSLEVNDGMDTLFGPITAVTDGDGHTSFDLWRYGYDLDYDVYLEVEDISTGISNSMKVEKFTGFEDDNDPSNKFLYGELPLAWPRNFAIELGEAGLPVYHVSVEPNPDGTWRYDLGDKVIEGWGAFLYDGNGNATMVSKEEDVVPNRFIQVDIHGNRIRPINFGPNSDVKISVYQSEGDSVPLDTWDVTLSSDYSYVFDTDEVVPPRDLAPGMVVNIQDNIFGSSEREFTLEFISVTNFDPDTNSISGIMSADMSGSTFNIRVFLVGGETHNVMVDVNEGGNWDYVFDSTWDIDKIIIQLQDFDGGDVTSFVLNCDSFIREVDTSGDFLIMEDDQGYATTISIPEAAITETISLSYTPQEAPETPDGTSFAGAAFDLTASQGGVVIEDYVFQVPITITLEYSDEDIINQNEDSLTLNYWNDSAEAWLDAATTCDPTSEYDRYPADNNLEIEICHLSKFSLIGENQFIIYLPVIIDPE